jgi:uncharacterized protein (DUF2345 family)
MSLLPIRYALAAAQGRVASEAMDTLAEEITALTLAGGDQTRIERVAPGRYRIHASALRFGGQAGEPSAETPIANPRAEEAKPRTTP